MKFHSLRKGFTLLETVIAIGVLAVLLTGFMYVFGPAASGIRRAINFQEADRLVSSLEKELVTIRKKGDTTTGFGKAYEWIKNSHSSNDAILAYQYRGNPSELRPDGSMKPLSRASGTPGRDYIVVPMVRRLSDAEFADDVTAIEGPLFFVKCTQLIYTASGAEMEASESSKGQIKDPESGGGAGGPDEYGDAVIAFKADFHSLPTRTQDYLRGPGFKTRFEQAKNPVFSRNLAVRR